MEKLFRKKYDSSFKREAVRLADESGKRDRKIERELGIYQGAIRHWRNELEEDKIHAFPGTGHQKPLEEENWRLRKELARAQRERDILKKAAAYFSMDVIKDLRS
jgi:transposase-like protein